MWDDIDWGDIDWSEIPLMEEPTFDPPLELDTSTLGDPFADWGGGAGGDGTNGSGDWSSGLGGLGSLGAGLGSGASSFLTTIGKALGLTNSNGELDQRGLMSLLTMLGMGAGMLNQNGATKDATEQIQNAANAANAKAEELIGGARGNYKPFIDAGTQAISGLQGMVGNSNLGSKYGGSVSPQVLAAISPIAAKSMNPMNGAMTLAQLAGRR